MATKLKNISYSDWFRVLLVLVGICGVVLGFYGALKYPDFPYGVRSDSRFVLEQAADQVRSNLLLLNQYKSPEHIKAGAVLDEAELQDAIEEAQFDRSRQISSINRRYEGMLAGQVNQAEVQRLTQERDEKIAAENRQYYEKKAAQAKDDLIAKQLGRYNEASQRLAAYEGLSYTLIENGAVAGPQPEYYDSLPFYQKTDQGGLTVYVGFSQATVQQQIAEYDARHRNGLTGIYMLLAGLALIVLSIAYLMYVAGRVPGKPDLQFNLLDRIYLDVGLWLAGMATLLSGAGASAIIVRTHQLQDIPLLDLLALALLIFAYLIFAAYCVVFAKRVKSREVLRHTLVYYLIQLAGGLLGRTVKTAVVAAVEVRTDYQKVLVRKTAVFLMLFTVGLGLVRLLYISLAQVSSFLAFLVALGGFIALVAGAVVLLLKRADELMSLVGGLRKIRDGELEHKIPLTGRQPYDAVAGDINKIADGVKAAVDRQVKAEHLKVELITNVSHDLKTPLTSIITYSDLLSRADGEGAEAKKYAEIIHQKSVYLKQMVDDLFEISKAQSRSITAKLEKLSLNDLITQSLAEFETEFTKAGLTVVLNLPQERTTVLADGTRLWRVLSNVYGNALKYSLPGTRVYIDLVTAGGKASVAVKNIANYPMNFAAGEIVERFKRGDESRSGEGSGLGLAIVKSFMELQNGACEIVVDGDLFKVILTVPLA